VHLRGLYGFNHGLRIVAIVRIFGKVDSPSQIGVCNLLIERES
jgi:hypothetical protein